MFYYVRVLVKFMFVACALELKCLRFANCQRSVVKSIFYLRLYSTLHLIRCFVFMLCHDLVI